MRGASSSSGHFSSRGARGASSCGGGALAAGRFSAIEALSGALDTAWRKIDAGGEGAASSGVGRWSTTNEAIVAAIASAAIPTA